MTSGIKYQGKFITRPGAYTETDASGLNVVQPGASGIVAVIGEAVGGKPVSAMNVKKDIDIYSTATAARGAFRSGDLYEVMNMLFRPSFDPDIPGGAAQVVPMKVNPSTQSTLVLENADGPAVDITSVDYGAFTEQISVELLDGTNQGKLVKVQLENENETIDDVGGAAVVNLRYYPGSDGFTTVNAAVAANGNITATATKANLGLDNQVDNSITNVAAEIVSADVGDTGQVVELFGVVAGVPTIEQLALDGTTVVTGSVVWDAGGLLGVRITGTTAGVVTVREIGGAGTDTFTVPAGANPEEGLITCGHCFVDDALVTLVSDGASTNDVILFGVNKVGAAVNEVVTLTGTTPVNSTATDFARIDVIVLGDIEAAQTVTLSCTALTTSATVQNNLVKLSDFINAKGTLVSTGPNVYEGFRMELLSGNTNFDPANFDTIASTAIQAAALDITADLYALIAAINQNSQLITAAESTGATGVPDNTPAPAFLAGGIEGVATFSDWQKALDLLRLVRVNTIVDLSGDPAVAAALAAHCAFMGGEGRSERDGIVGVLNAAGDDVPTKTQLLQAAVDLNTRHIRCVGQAITRYNAAGELTEFMPQFLGAMLAGMQAGSEVGTAATYKFLDLRGLREHSSWNITDDVEELIQGGVTTIEEVDGVGFRCVRSRTTHLSDSNLAYTEPHVNEEVNYFSYGFRNTLEFALGRKGFEGTETALRLEALQYIRLQGPNGENTISGHKNLEFTLDGDVWVVSIDIAPVISTNFITIKQRLITNDQLAA